MYFFKFRASSLLCILLTLSLNLEAQAGFWKKVRSVAKVAVNPTGLLNGQSYVDPEIREDVSKTLKKAGKDIAREWKVLPPELQVAIIVVAVAAGGYALAPTLGAEMGVALSVDIGAKTVTIPIATSAETGAILTGVGAGAAYSSTAKNNNAQKNNEKSKSRVSQRKEEVILSKEKIFERETKHVSLPFGGNFQIELPPEKQVQEVENIIERYCNDEDCTSYENIIASAQATLFQFGAPGTGYLLSSPEFDRDFATVYNQNIEQPQDTFCFPSGTSVETPEGEKFIERLSVDDYVVSEDQENEQCVLSKVEAVFEHEVDELTLIKFESGSLKSTRDHPFYIIELEEYIRADEIEEGMHFLSVSGEEIYVESTEILPLETPIKVHNLRVQDNHNYFVGNSKILTHNCDGFVQGVTETVEHMFYSLEDAILHPIETAKGVGNAILNADKVAKALSIKIETIINEYPGYTDSEKGKLIGSVSTEIAAFFAPAGGILKAGSKLGSLAQDVRFTNKLFKATKEVTEELGGSAKELVELWKQHPERGSLKLGQNHKYHPAPKLFEAFPDLQRAKPKTPIQGGGGLRKRWTDKKGNIYEWDSQHGTLEKYSRKGKHIGEFDPKTGRQTKQADLSRDIKKYL